MDDFPSILLGGAYYMRKIALLVICLSMLITLVGCGQSQIPSDTKQEEIDITKQVEKTDSKENKKYSLDALKSIYYRLVSAELVPDEKYSSVMSRLRELE